MEEKLDSCLVCGDIFFVLYLIIDCLSFDEVVCIGRYICEWKINGNFVMIIFIGIKKDLEYFWEVDEMEGSDLL